VTGDGLSGRVQDTHLRSRYDRKVALFQIDHLLRMRQHRHHVGSHERCLARPPDHERAAGTGRHQRARLLLAHGHDRIAAMNLFRGGTHGLRERLAVLHVFGDQMRHDFGIGFRFEPVALFLQLVLERQIIFDDAVVDEHAGAGAVRMRVLLGRPAVRRPTGMPDADRAAELLLRQRLAQVRQLADAAPHVDPAVVQHGHAGRIVAAILQPLQPIQ
jgi:hypothetical protein